MSACVLKRHGRNWHCETHGVLERVAPPETCWKYRAVAPKAGETTVCPGEDMRDCGPPADRMSDYTALVARLQEVENYLARHNNGWARSVHEAIAALTPPADRVADAGDAQALREALDYVLADFENHGDGTLTLKLDLEDFQRLNRLASADRAATAPAPEGLNDAPPVFWHHAIQECNEAHVALDREGAPKTKIISGRDRVSRQEITLGLRDRIAALRASPVLSDETDFWRMVGDDLQSGGMYDPAFLAGMVRAKAGLLPERPVLSDEVLREMAAEWAGRLQIIGEYEPVIAFARAVLARQQEGK